MGWSVEPSTGEKVWLDDRAGVVALKDSAGNVHKIDPADVGDALRSGYSVATPDDVHAAERKTKAGSPLRAAAEGALAEGINVATAPVRVPYNALADATGIDPVRAATGKSLDEIAGGRPVLENIAALGGEAFGGNRTGEAIAREYADTARATAEEHPVASTIGRVLGATAAMRLSGAAGALGELGGAVQAATGSRALSMGATGLLEGAGYGQAQADEETYLENVPRTAERVWANVGLGALLAGGTGAGLGAIADRFAAARAARAALGATRSAEDEALTTVAARSLGTEPAPGLGAKLRDVYENAASALAGEEHAPTIKSFGAQNRSPEAMSGRELWRNREALIDRSIGDFTEAASEMRAAREGVFDEVVDSSLKRGHIDRLITTNKQAALEAAKEQALTIAEKLGELDDAATFGDQAWARGPKTYLVGKFDEVFSATEAKDAAGALDEIKRQLQKLGRKAEAGAAANGADLLKRDQLQGLADVSKQLAEDVRTHLEDTSIYGKFGEAQQRTNAAWKRFLDSSQFADQQMLTRVGDDYGRARMEVDPGKVGAFMDRLGTRRGELPEKYVREHIDATKNLVDELTDSYELTGKHAARIEAVRGAYDKAAGALDSASKTVKVANQIDALVKAEQQGAGALMGGGAVLGGLTAGPVGAAIGALAGATARPGSAIVQAARLEALAANVPRRINRALDGVFGVTRSIAGSATRALPEAAGVARTAGEVSALAIRRDVAALVSDPGQLEQRITDAIGPAAQALPETHSALTSVALRATSFLQSKLPPVTSPGVLDGTEESPVAPSDLDAFMRYYEAVRDPLRAIDSMRDGDLEIEHVEAIQAVYPDLYETLQQSVFTYVAEATHRGYVLPYQKRLQLDLLFGGGGALEPTMATDFQLTIQQAFTQPPPAPKPRARSKTPAINRGGSPLDKLEI